MIIHFLNRNKKSLKIPKGQSEAVNKRTDNTMTKKKKDKKTNKIYKTLHGKLKIGQHEFHKKWGLTRVIQKMKQFLLH